jgi:hypothetical protein
MSSARATYLVLVTSLNTVKDADLLAVSSDKVRGGSCFMYSNAKQQA